MRTSICFFEPFRHISREITPLSQKADNCRLLYRCFMSRSCIVNIREQTGVVEMFEELKAFQLAIKTERAYSAVTGAYRFTSQFS